MKNEECRKKAAKIVFLNSSFSILHSQFFILNSSFVFESTHQ